MTVTLEAGLTYAVPADCPRTLDGAVATLEALRKRGAPLVVRHRFHVVSWQHWLIIANHGVARAFDLDWHAVLEAWIETYGRSLLAPPEPVL